MDRNDTNETGLPLIERVFLGAMLRTGALLPGPRRAIKLFSREANRVLQIVDEHDYDFAGTRVKIPRLQGIENASRNWSLYMVLDHLVRVDSAILNTIKCLCDGYQPLSEIAIADFKPDPDADVGVLETFQETAREFQRDVLALMPIHSKTRFEHPWFGPLNARQWIMLAAAHHRIHRRQAHKIVTVQGTT